MLQKNIASVESLALQHAEITKSLSNSIGLEVEEKVKDKYNSFYENYMDQIKGLHRERKDIEKALNELKKDNNLKKDIQKAISRNKYESYRRACKSGSITNDKMVDLIKSETGEKVRYADIIVRNLNGDILLLQRASTDKSNPGKWGVPGGHVDIGEDCEDAAKRELFEETGIKKEYITQIGEYEDDNVKIKYYEAHCDNDPLILLDNEEHHDWKWINPYTEIDDYEMPFNMKENLKRIINPINAQVTSIKKALDSGDISFDQYSGIVLSLLNKKEQIFEKALSDSMKRKIEDYIMNHEGEFNDDDVHKYAEKLGIDYEEMEEHIFSIARKYLNENE